MIGAFLAAGFQNNAFQVEVASTKVAGNYKKRNYIIDGRRVSLTRSELDAELYRLVVDASKTPEQKAKTIEVSNADPVTAEFETIQGPFGIELRILLEGMDRQRAMEALHRAEMEALGPRLAIQTNQRLEDEMFLLMLAG